MIIFLYVSKISHLGWVLWQPQGIAFPVSTLCPSAEGRKYLRATQRGRGVRISHIPHLPWRLGINRSQSCESRRQTNSTCSRPRFREIWKVLSLSRSLPLSGKKVSPRSRPRFGFSRPPPTKNESSIAVRGSRLPPPSLLWIYLMYPPPPPHPTHGYPPCTLQHFPEKFIHLLL